jgi:hypothetical protein
MEYDKLPTRVMSYSPDGGIFGTAIPGFPIPDDARSIRTATSLQRSGSVSKVIRRVRGEGKLFVALALFLAHLRRGHQACREITGWTMRIARSVTTARACSPLGGESTIAEYVVSTQSFKHLPFRK